MLVWEGIRCRSGWGLGRLNACMRRIQTQEWVGFVQVWCKHEKDSNARVSKFFAGLMLAWEGFKRKGEGVFGRFDDFIRRIQRPEGVRFVQVWCLYEKDSDARVGEVCPGLMLVWEAFRRRCVWGLCRFDACMRRIQTQEWGSFWQVWWFYEKDSDARGSEVCTGLMKAWEGFRRKSGWSLCRFDACMRRNQMQEWLKFLQVKCLHENDSDAGVGEVCSGLMLAWEGFRR